MISSLLTIHQCKITQSPKQNEEGSREEKTNKQTKRFSTWDSHFSLFCELFREISLQCWSNSELFREAVMSADFHGANLYHVHHRHTENPVSSHQGQSTSVEHYESLPFLRGSNIKFQKRWSIETLRTRYSSLYQWQKRKATGFDAHFKHCSAYLACRPSTCREGFVHCAAACFQVQCDISNSV